MTLSEYLDHWRLIENPFQGEEARHDSVLARMMARRSGEGSPRSVVHSDFDKILGPLSSPSTAVVFGEKGSGKTAMRLQIAQRIAEHNAANPTARILLVGYDDLGGVLERLHAFHAEKDPLESLQKTRLVDHLDAILAIVAPRVVDAILGREGGPESVQGSPEGRKAVRRLEPATRRDLLLAQALYDRPDDAGERTGALRRRLGLRRPLAPLFWRLLALAGWVLPLGVLAVFVWDGGRSWTDLKTIDRIVLAALAAVWLAAVVRVGLIDRVLWLRLARRIRRQTRAVGRSEGALAAAIPRLDRRARDPARLPLTDSDEPRYALLDSLRKALAAFGYAGMVVVVDRVDEPTIVSGDPRRMQAVVWPMLSNRFLQSAGVGVKMLLPVELRHALFRESSAFFQEARLDKQSLVERLSWTGAMLYDLCESRLRACASAGATPPALLDLFAEDVTRQDLVDALDQMHQPRDAFKFVYRCLAEHCSNVTADQGQWRVPRLVLESVRRQESERIQGLQRGIRPA